jgi:hypothetical protein
VNALEELRKLTTAWAKTPHLWEHYQLDILFKTMIDLLSKVEEEHWKSIEGNNTKMIELAKAWAVKEGELNTLQEQVREIVVGIQCALNDLQKSIVDYDNHYHIEFNDYENVIHTLEALRAAIGEVGK